MGDFSRSPLEFLKENLDKGYVGVHIEQGVPILDRDLNLMHDLVSAVARAITTRYIGSGIAAEQDGFEIVAVPGDDNDLRINDFRILAGPSGQPGTCLVDGIEVTIDNPFNYKERVPPLPALNTPEDTQPNPRFDVVFLDVWLSELDGNHDEHLRNPGDVGMQTSVRLRPMWAVRVKEGVAEGAGPPAPDSGHAHYPLARLTRRRENSQITTEMIKDLRHRRLTLADLEQRVQDIERLRTLPAFSDGTQFDQFTGAPGTEVKLFGRNFDLGRLSVRFGDKPAALVGDPTPTEVTVVVPEGLALGNVHITVTTRVGSVVSREPFTVLPPAPVIDDIKPRRARPETEVEITGKHFVDGETTVTFGDESVRIVSITNTKILTKVPIVGPGNHPITVTTEWGTSRPPVPFEVVQGIPS